MFFFSPLHLKMTSIKVTYNSHNRRINVDVSTTWNEITDRLSQAFNATIADSIVLEYLDADNDVISLNTSQELQEAIGHGITSFSLSELPTTTLSSLISDDTERWVLVNARVKKTLHDVGIEYLENKGRHAMSVDRRAQCTIVAYKRLEQQWFTFLEAKGYKREWNIDLVTIGMCSLLCLKVLVQIIR